MNERAFTLESGGLSTLSDDEAVYLDGMIEKHGLKCVLRSLQALLESRDDCARIAERVKSLVHHPDVADL